MHIDYTLIFDSPDELADFLILPQAEQDRRLVSLMTHHNHRAVLVCELRRKEPSHE